MNGAAGKAAQNGATNGAHYAPPLGGPAEQLATWLVGVVERKGGQLSTIDLVRGSASRPDTLVEPYAVPKPHEVPDLAARIVARAEHELAQVQGEQVSFAVSARPEGGRYSLPLRSNALAVGGGDLLARLEETKTDLSIGALTIMRDLMALYTTQRTSEQAGSKWLLEGATKAYGQVIAGFTSANETKDALIEMLMRERADMVKEAIAVATLQRELAAQKNEIELEREALKLEAKRDERRHEMRQSLLGDVWPFALAKLANIAVDQGLIPKPVAEAYLRARAATAAAKTGGTPPADAGKAEGTFSADAQKAIDAFLKGLQPDEMTKVFGSLGEESRTRLEAVLGILGGAP